VSLSSAFQSLLLETLTKESGGEPPWVEAFAQGDDEGYFGPGSAPWVVHGELPTLVAGVRALLMQALHPGALAGVHDHSRYEEDPLGRLSGTIRWLMSVTFGSTATAQQASAMVGRLHDRVVGTYVDARGEERPYAAGDPELLTWVHVAFTEAFLGAQLQWGSPIPGGADAYIGQWAVAGELMGVPAPPRSLAEHEAALAGFDADLKYDERTARVVRFLRNPGLSPAVVPAYKLLFEGAVASLPERYRELLQLRRTRARRAAAIGACGAFLSIADRLVTHPGASEIAARQRISRVRANRFAS
jgi:uncharacterized protein (DUF2236 family)